MPERFEDGSCEARIVLDRRGSVQADHNKFVLALNHYSKNFHSDETLGGMAVLSPAPE
jgi:hypothetical protein